LGPGRLAPGKKNAARIGAALVFLDESGFLMMPLVRRTWAPRGQTPLIRHGTNSYRKVSAIAALVVSPDRDRVQLFFRLHPQANINAGSVLSFLQQLRRHLQCPIVLLWDRFMPHRARLVHDYISGKEDWRSEFLPAYAPELNPVENVWCYLKTNPMANEALFELDNLAKSTWRHGRALQRREPLLRSLLSHTPLFLRLK
jgi:transposase